MRRWFSRKQAALALMMVGFSMTQLGAAPVEFTAPTTKKLSEPVAPQATRSGGSREVSLGNQMPNIAPDSRYSRSTRANKVLNDALLKSGLGKTRISEDFKKELFSAYNRGTVSTNAAIQDRNQRLSSLKESSKADFAAPKTRDLEGMSLDKNKSIGSLRGGAFSADSSGPRMGLELARPGTVSPETRYLQNRLEQTGSMGTFGRGAFSFGSREDASNPSASGLGGELKGKLNPGLSAPSAAPEAPRPGFGDFNSRNPFEGANPSSSGSRPGSSFREPSRLEPQPPTLKIPKRTI